MDSLERLMRAAPLPRMLTSGVVATAAAAAATAATAASGGKGSAGIEQRALVHASLAAATVGRKGRHLTGTFCLTGDTMEGIIQCLVFLKAFSVSRDQSEGQTTTKNTPKNGGGSER
ncbi:GL14281 [Drosophila persimilis]|uniref:GL14281 n=1 Tax=Drosophila persimilis TaxID=7234 RepID=B4GTG1_DROPE|nr:GL14281 [Drosophila persimilis]